MLQIVAERVREARTEGFEPGCLAALLRMEGCGVRVAARPVADDAGRLELRVFDDIIVTVSERDPQMGGGEARRSRLQRHHRYGERESERSCAASHDTDGQSAAW